MYFAGIDLGTSSVKIVITDSSGNLMGSTSRDYPISYPKSGWAEQNPYSWIEEVRQGFKEITKEIDGSKIAGIGFGGQMHGLVVVDDKDCVIRPAILWNDGRTFKQVEYLNNIVGKEKLIDYTGNIAYAGFTAPKIMWMYENERDKFYRINKIMLPKDYISYYFSGEFSTDYSDASGMLLLDVKNKEWSKYMMDICHVRNEQLPRLYESYQVVGTIREEIADDLGISRGCKIVAGAGDNAAAAVGTGTVGDNQCNISLGTSGTIFISCNTYGKVGNSELHSFAHADGRYHLMGCILSAASCNKWWMDNIIGTNDYSKEQDMIGELGENEVFFLPYLMGERSPLNDVSARGAFIGMSADTKREDMTQAVLEGVIYALRDCYEVAKGLGIELSSTRVCGGGAKSRLWKVMLANILAMPVEELELDEGPGLGGAMLAMVGCGIYANVEEASKAIVRVKDVIIPRQELIDKYENRYKKYVKLYPCLKGNF